MAQAELIDTTEMYLKTIFEMEEDGIVPMRARIVQRLGHSGPTVSQTVARMERDGLVQMGDGRRLELTGAGRLKAARVMRKHRLAERLLLDVIGLDWEAVHEEACRWEHVMSDEVQEKIAAVLGDPQSDPYGNPVPSGLLERYAGGGVSLDDLNVRATSHETPSGSEVCARLLRIGEPLQAQPGVLRALRAAGIVPNADVCVSFADDYELRAAGAAGAPVLRVPTSDAQHLFFEPVRRD